LRGEPRRFDRGMRHADSSTLRVAADSFERPGNADGSGEDIEANHGVVEFVQRNRRANVAGKPVRGEYRAGAAWEQPATGEPNRH
jgi:hypothetical protein